MDKIVGRDKSCDYIICDPQNRISRRHVQVINRGGALYLTDLNSSNGTYVNGNRIPPNLEVRITDKDRVLLSNSYPLNLKEFLVDEKPTDPEKTVILGQKDHVLQCQNGYKKINIDPEKTTLGEMLQVDPSKYISVGRVPGNDVVINNSNISRNHCKLKLINQVTFEIIDVGSSNGTYVDQVKLIPHQSAVFYSCARVTLGKEFALNLKSCLPAIQLLPEKKSVNNASGQKMNSTTPTKEEMQEFNELEPLWRDYNDRILSAQQIGGSYMMGGMAVSSIASIAFGPIGAIVGLGSSLFARYLGQQKSNEIRQDTTYEDNFLVLYACPRCNESFQKKPWVTIRECFKCKTKFR